MEHAAAQASVDRLTADIAGAEARLVRLCVVSVLCVICLCPMSCLLCCVVHEAGGGEEVRRGRGQVVTGERTDSVGGCDLIVRPGCDHGVPE
jgi:hypothetical protein